MKNILLILTIAIVINCKSVSYPQSDIDSELFMSEIVDYITANLTSKTNLDSETTDDGFNFETTYSLNNDFETLLPRAYRTWEGKNDVDIITDKWIELYREKDKYFLGKANFKIDNGFDECVEVKTRAIVSKNETVLFMDLPELKEGEITSLKIDKNKILPGEKIYFTYNNLKYYIRAEGKIISYNGNELNRKLALDDIEAYTINSNGDTVYATQTLVVDDEDDTFPEVEDYKLFISTQDSKEQLFLQISSFNDSFVTLVFVGDIDRDGKLDFIFDTSRDYEVETKSLYLSSKALPNQIIKLVSVASVQFDC